MAQISFEHVKGELILHGTCYVRDWYLISGEGDCGEGGCGEGDCGEGDCGEGDCGEGDCGEGEW